MSYFRAITATLRIDKLLKGINYMLTGDIITIGSYYVMIVFNMLMIAVVMYVFKWLLFISC